MSEEGHAGSGRSAVEEGVELMELKGRPDLIDQFELNRRIEKLTKDLQSAQLELLQLRNIAHWLGQRDRIPD